MIRQIVYLCSALFFSFINNNIAHAQTFTTFNEFKNYIDKLLKESIAVQPGEELKINLLQIDEKMKLPTCLSTIDTSIRQPGLSSPSNSITLKCNDANPWVLYIPVQVKLMTDMVMASRKIMPNEVLSDTDVMIQKNDKYQLIGQYFSDKNQVSGLVSSRLIPPGSVITKQHLKAALMIKKNQNITLILQHGAIEISMSGIAKTDGYMNDKIKIINPSSQKVVDATVVGPNKAIIEY